MSNTEDLQKNIPLHDLAKNAAQNHNPSRQPQIVTNVDGSPTELNKRKDSKDRQ
jgi:hypothetical protein